MAAKDFAVLNQQFANDSSRRRFLKLLGGAGASATLAALLGPDLPLSAHEEDNHRHGRPDRRHRGRHHDGHRSAASTGSGPVSLEPTEEEEALLRAAEFYARLEGVGALDYETGLVRLDAKGLRAVLDEYLAAEEAAAYYAALTAHAELGFAVAGGPREIENGRGVAVPWGMVSYLAREAQPDNDLGLVAHGVLADLGVLGAASVEEVEHILRSRFPNVPARAPRDPGDGGGGGGGGGSAQNIIEAVFELVRRFKDFVVGEIPKEDTRTVEDCFKQAKWHVNWLGWQVCFDPTCAKKVADALIGLGTGSGGVVAAIKQMLITLGIAAGPAGAVALALAIYAVALGLALAAALRLTPNNGACLAGNWPIFTPFGVILPHVIATPRP